MSPRLLAILLLIPTCAYSAAKIVQRDTFEPTVTAVGADSITVKTGRNAGTKVTNLGDIGVSESTQAASNVKVYQVNSFTTITVDALPGTLADVKTGMIVRVDQGTDANVANSIDAHTVPPPVAAPKKTAKPVAKGKGPGTKAAFRKITADTVLSISATRITVGQLGAKTARAYFINAATTVTIDGAAGKPADLHEGMDVDVHGDSTTAEEIDAHAAQ